MKTRITETIEFTVSYLADDEDVSLSLPDLRDVLTEGAASYLPFGCARAHSTWELGVRKISCREEPNA